jgi:hypothetical protein
MRSYSDAFKLEVALLCSALHSLGVGNSGKSCVDSGGTGVTGRGSRQTMARVRTCLSCRRLVRLERARLCSTYTTSIEL